MECSPMASVLFIECGSVTKPRRAELNFARKYFRNQRGGVRLSLGYSNLIVGEVAKRATLTYPFSNYLHTSL
jgi:hypothetical protein